jgi:uncharacterized protein YyaL (SSP411 family)
MPDSSRYEKEARRVIDLVKNSFVSSKGYLFLERTGLKILDKHIFPDLGDFIPFFLYFGEEEFVKEQVDLYARERKGPYLVSQFASLGMKELVKSYEYTDLILGLGAWWEVEKQDASRKKILDETVGAADKAFAIFGNYRSFYYPPFHIGLPVIDTRDATLIECFTTIYRSTKDEKYLERARAIYATLIQTEFFREHGLFADYVPTSLLARRFLADRTEVRRATICKNNSNALFALLDLYQVTKDEKVLHTLETLMNAVLTKVRGSDGGIAERFIPEKPTGSAYLTASFPIIDFLCDFADAHPPVREQALKEARSLADFWISQQGETGLFPLRPNKPETFFDSETDMCVALYKLAELTKEQKYYQAAERCLAGIIKYHGQADYPLAVRVDNGEVVDETQRTKFLCLLLKLLILKIEEAKGNSIFGTPYLFELLKDR